MRYPTASQQHRDCILGCSFLLAAWDFFPKSVEPPAELRTACGALRAIHQSLAVDKLPAGAIRDIDACCDTAADGGVGYDSDWEPSEIWKGWMRMFFLGWYALTDAVNTASAWVPKQAELWKTAQKAADVLYFRWIKKYPREEQFACRVWCADASPYARPELKEWLS